MWRTNVAAVLVGLLAAAAMTGLRLLLGDGAIPVGHATVAPTIDLTDRPDHGRTVLPPSQVDDDRDWTPRPRVDDGGRTLFVPVIQSSCVADEVRLLDEHEDEVDVKVRRVSTDFGTLACLGSMTGSLVAVVHLDDPLDDRTVVIRHE
ncbi:hypothetical protein [Actinokineospora enzanensis]|uniref:hypothetical protein n=1 Tax=Actinokineospora enzanensis TaxID=155975 RepID=UPI000382D23C|nr:hypothetical protein [Actinokineospora enzanensis]